MTFTATNNEEIDAQNLLGSQVLPRANELINVFASTFPAPENPTELLGVIQKLHYNHLKGWAGEDACRDEIQDEKVAAAKRATDANNVARVRLIEQIDAWLSNKLPSSPRAPLHTETIGSVIDRLGIAWVRVQQLRRRSTTSEKVNDTQVHLAEYQLDQLATAYDTLLDEVLSGERRVPYWEFIKSYGER